jgi:hypothetical protein
MSSLLVGGIYFQKSFNNFQINIMNYKENNSVDYKVFLKPNNYFETPYLEKGKTYITNLIDYIDTEFIYNVEFDNKVKGTYDYKIVATISANKTDDDNSNYWSKSYILKEQKDNKVNNASNLYLSEKVKIDYNKYNDLLNSFKKEFALAVSGILKVELVITTNLNSEVITKDINIDSNLSWDIPLTLQAVEASINLEEGVKVEKTITEKIAISDQKYQNYRLFGFANFGISICLLFVLFWYSKEEKERNIYEVSLKRILSTYDSVIVNIKVMPSMSDLQQIKVESFEELIDAHSEVRMPINYYNDKKREASIFFLISEGVVWIYILKKHYDKK